ncbi:hypothetical protein Hjap01_03874 [Haloarcula japonica]
MIPRLDGITDRLLFGCKVLIHSNNGPFEPRSLCVDGLDTLAKPLEGLTFALNLTSFS